MHVLIIPSWYFPAGTNEISGRMFHQLAHSMRKEGIDARIFFAKTGMLSPLIKHVQFEIEDEVPTWRALHWSPPKINSLMTRWWIHCYTDLLLDYIATEGKPDLIHAQSFSAAIATASLKTKLNIPLIVTERLSGFITGNIPKHYHPFIRSSFDQADVITTVSPGMKKHLQRFTANAIDVIPNFFDPSVFYYDPLIKKNKTFTWISIGEPAHTKGLDILMEAYGQFRKKFPAYKMQLIMIDEIKEKEGLKKTIERHGFADEIIWTGLIEQKEIARILRESHVLISASRVESFGKAIVEAQACGLPVIATKTDGSSFIMESSNNGILIEIDNVEQLAEAMTDMYENYNRYNSVVITDSTSSRFSEKTVVQQWKEKYIEFAS